MSLHDKIIRERNEGKTVPPSQAQFDKAKKDQEKKEKRKKRRAPVGWVYW